MSFYVTIPLHLLGAGFWVFVSFLEQEKEEKERKNVVSVHVLPQIVGLQKNRGGISSGTVWSIRRQRQRQRQRRRRKQAFIGVEASAASPPGLSFPFRQPPFRRHRS